MGKKKGSAKDFLNFIDESEKENVDNMYNNNNSARRTQLNTAAKESPPVSSKEDNEDNEDNKDSIKIEKVSPETKSNELKENSQTTEDNKKKKSQKNENLREKDKLITGPKIFRKKDRALFILSKSEEFEGITTKGDMLDYILENFFSKKNIKEVLEKGLKY